MKKIIGTKSRPRLVVFRSNRHIYAQVVNDFDEKVITGASSQSPEIKKKKFKSPKERAREVGKVVAKRALDKKIKKVTFDKGKFKYHGNVKELSEGAREKGLKF